MDSLDAAGRPVNVSCPVASPRGRAATSIFLAYSSRGGTGRCIWAERRRKSRWRSCGVACSLARCNYLPAADDVFSYMPPYGKPVVGKRAPQAANEKSFSDRTVAMTMQPLVEEPKQ